MPETLTQTETLTRGLCDDVDVRAIDVDGRSATFVAATENGVETYFGTEYLRMSGADLSRYRRNSVVLDTHNRFEAGAIIGKATVSIANRELVAVITFAETERADEIWQLVRGGFLKALSVGFRARDVQVIEEGESSGSGKSKIQGPARIVKDWQLYEISVVPVGADAEALKRSFLYAQSIEDELRSLRETVNELLTKESNMSGNDKAEETERREAAEKAKAAESKSGDEMRGSPDNLKVEDVLTAEEIRHRDIRSMAPAGMEDLADECVLKGQTVSEARTRMLEEHAKGCKPVGTPEPEDAKRGKGDDATDVPKVADVTDDMLLRTFAG